MKKTVSFNVVAEPFGSPDGTTNEFQLAYQGQKLIRPSYLNVTAMHQTDWQGRVALSSTPRTNSAPNSDAVLAWSAGDVTLAASGTTPSGAAATSMIPTTANVQHIVSTPALSAGVVSFACVAKANGYNYLIVQFADGTGYPQAIIDMQSGAVISPSPGLTATLVGLGSGWWEIYASLTDASSGHWTLLATQTSAGGQVFAGDGVSGYLIGSLDCVSGVAPPFVHIVTGSAPVTLTDYAVDTSGNVTLGQDPVAKATLDWDGSATCDFVDASATFLSQYATAPIITSLIQTANAAIDPQADFEGFLANVWNIYTAQGFGLDIWGRIVNIPRTINIPATVAVLGFEEASDAHYYPFNQEPFYNGPTGGTLYTLTDDAYRMLILTKALANISSFTAESMNALLNFMFNGQGTTRGSCYVLETATPMQIQYVFNFALQSWEAAVMQQASLMPRPAGVGITIIVNP